MTWELDNDTLTPLADTGRGHHVMKGENAEEHFQYWHRVAEYFPLRSESISGQIGVNSL